MYAYLHVATADFDRVRFPDGSEALVAGGAGEAAATEWRVEQAKVADPAVDLSQPHPDEIAKGLRLHEARLAEWQERLDRELDKARNVPQMRRLHADFLAEDPQPVLDPRWDEPSLQKTLDELGLPAPAVISERHWHAALAEVDREDFILGPDGPYPRAAVARALSELEQEGWSVVHVSEDRVVAYGEEGAAAQAAGGWMLLHSAGNSASATP
jgi:hypothetical protein